MGEAFLLEVSKRIKENRLEKKLTVQELADRCKLSKGFISQVENGRTVPSLPVIFNIIQALEMEVGRFFENIQTSQPTILVQKKQNYEAFQKEEAVGFYYNRIFTRSIGSSTTDFVLLEIQKDSFREEVSTDAFEFKYILKGSVEYKISGSRFVLEEGDSLFFDGRLPHVPKCIGPDSCQMLIIYFFNAT